MSEKCEGCKYNTGNWRDSYICDDCSRFYKDRYERKKAKKIEVEVPIILTDEQITEMYESGYISDKEEFKDGND